MQIIRDLSWISANVNLIVIRDELRLIQQSEVVILESRVNYSFDIVTIIEHR